jgi:hypothetical protein
MTQITWSMVMVNGELQVELIPHFSFDGASVMANDFA